MYNIIFMFYIEDMDDSDFDTSTSLEYMECNGTHVYTLLYTYSISFSDFLTFCDFLTS